MKKEIVRDLNFLRKPCEPVNKGEDIKAIIQDLKDSLDPEKGYGLASNQLGYSKRIFYVKFPKIDPKTKQISYEEEIVINPTITNKQFPFRFQNEGCLSLPGLKIATRRYNFIQVEYVNEKFEPKNVVLIGLKAVIWAHEIDHGNGILIYRKKWKNNKT